MKLHSIQIFTHCIGFSLLNSLKQQQKKSQCLNKLIKTTHFNITLIRLCRHAIFPISDAIHRIRTISKCSIIQQQETQITNSIPQPPISIHSQGKLKSLALFRTSLCNVINMGQILISETYLCLRISNYQLCYWRLLTYSATVWREE